MKSLATKDHPNLFYAMPVPNKKKRVGGKDGDDDNELFSLANLDQLAELEHLAEAAGNMS